MQYHTPDLFGSGPAERRHEPLAPGAWLLQGYARTQSTALAATAMKIAAAAPFRQLETPGGFRMSVAMTNCGNVGWVSDRRGYRYEAADPATGRPWPAMPEVFRTLAEAAAAAGGFPGFAPDACLINRYVPGARMSLHQDRDEGEFESPIVSVSLGLPAIFLWGGDARSEKPRRVPLLHGDVVVWGGASRLRYHGIMPLKEGHHPELGAQRFNLTFRRV